MTHLPLVCNRIIKRIKLLSNILQLLSKYVSLPINGDMIYCTYTLHAPGICSQLILIIEVLTF